MMSKIINLTQHTATPEQVAAGVVEPSDKEEVRRLLTFDEPPTKADYIIRANALADLAKKAGADAAMIGGAPYFMSSLEIALEYQGIKPLYSFTRRESVDMLQADGSVRKVAVFKHVCFVE